MNEFESTSDLAEMPGELTMEEKQEKAEKLSMAAKAEWDACRDKYVFLVHGFRPNIPYAMLLGVFRSEKLAESAIILWKEDGILNPYIVKEKLLP